MKGYHEYQSPKSIHKKLRQSQSKTPSHHPFLAGGTSFPSFLDLDLESKVAFGAWREHALHDSVT